MNPESAALLQKAIAFQRQGALAEADRALRGILAAEPDHVDALYHFAVLACQAGDMAEGVARFEKVLALAPRHARALNFAGLARARLGRREEALAFYARAIEADPNLAEAYGNRADLLSELRRDAQALESYDRALALRPGSVEDLCNRAAVLRRLGRLEEALAGADRAIAAEAAFAPAHILRGHVLKDLQRHDAAVQAFDRALNLHRGAVEAWVARGDALAKLKRFDEAIAAYDAALKIAPGHAQAWCSRAQALFDARRDDEALRSFDRAISLDPDLPYAQGARLSARQQICEWTDFSADCERLLGGLRAGKPVVSPFRLLAIPSASPEDQLACASRFATAAMPGTAPRRAAGHSLGRIRVAYLSADFHQHATAQLAAGLFESHARDRFEIFGLSYGPDAHDPMRERLSRAFDHFLDVRSLSDRAVADLVRERGIDIAVDLKGWTEHARLGIFADRPAPLQVTYLGFPGTSGAPCFDYVIADRIVVPESDRRFFSEQVVYLPDSYQVNDCRRNPPSPAPPRVSLGLPAEGFVFCCFNDNYKITPDIFAVWMRLLENVAGSVLWLLGGRAAAERNLRREAQARGVDASRIVFAPRLPLDAHIARHGAADLFLDTLPCNAHTTASDALFAGLPVLTCPGATFAGRVAASLLRAAGLPELIAPSLEDYEALALKLARDPAALAALRAKLTGARAACPLFDTGRFTRHLEAAYVTMIEKYRRGEPPEGFAVESAG